jgi:hypothetical protein
VASIGTSIEELIGILENLTKVVQHLDIRMDELEAEVEKLKTEGCFLPD